MRSYPVKENTQTNIRLLYYKDEQIVYLHNNGTLGLIPSQTKIKTESSW